MTRIENKTQLPKRAFCCHLSTAAIILALVLSNAALSAQEKRPTLEPIAGDAAIWEPVVENGSGTHRWMRDWEAASPVMATNLGPQNSFYRYTQLQGHLVQNGLNLFEVPQWWTENSDFPYLKKDSDKEVFFVDRISITRFLGGYNQKKSFKGDHEDFLKLYDHSAAAILEVFPQAGIMPGEIGGPARSPENAINYPDLFQHFITITIQQESLQLQPLPREFRLQTGLRTKSSEVQFALHPDDLLVIQFDRAGFE